jgi:hypothetical protein
MNYPTPECRDRRTVEVGVADQQGDESEDGGGSVQHPDQSV